MKSIPLIASSAIALSISLAPAATTIFDAAGDPTLAGTGWNATGGTHPDSTPATSGDPASWGGTGGIANAGAATGNDWAGVGSSYVFDGVDDRFNDTSLDNFSTLYGFQPTTQPFSVDIYFSPTDLNEVGVLWETGGTGAGAGIVQNGNQLIFSVAENAANQSALTLDLNNLSPTAGAWYLARLTIDPGNSITASVTDGSGPIISGTTGFTGNDWAGTNGTGLGDFDGNIGGDVNGTLSAPLIAAGGDPTLLNNNSLIDAGTERGAWSFWTGQVGRVAYGAGSMANLTLVPEPSRALLLALGLLPLLLRRKR